MIIFKYELGAGPSLVAEKYINLHLYLYLCHFVESRTKLFWLPV